MDDKNEQIYSQYALNINNVSKSKGIVYLDTKDGYYMIKPYNYTEYKIKAENGVKEMLEEKGYGYTDMCMQNKSGEYISYNKYMNKFVLKRWFKSEECEVTDIEDMCYASANLGRIHKLMKGENYLSISGIGDSDKMLDETKNQLHIVEKNLLKEYSNQINELKRVKKYLYNKKRKNRLEIEIIKSLDYYYKEAVTYLEQLEQSAYEKLYKEAQEKIKICHGAYTHHGVLMLRQQKEVATINFDKMHIGVQIYDLYILLRKAMEKNNWNVDYAKQMIQAYNNEKVITQEEKQILKILLSYPEKYRKLINNYYNGKKSWLSIRIYEKLNELIATETKRQEFLLYI